MGHYFHSFMHSFNNVYDYLLHVSELDIKDPTVNKIFRDLRLYRRPRK